MSDVMEHPAWADVEAAVDAAKGMYWDGCHKIYLAMDDGQVKLMAEYGYERFDPFYRLLREWFEQSCGLRFVSAVHTVPGDPNKGFEDLIPQGFGEDEDDYDEEDYS